VGLLAVLAHLPSLANGFALDDVPIILNNALIHSFDLRAIWTGPYWPGGESLGLYRPLTSFLFAVQWAIGDGAPQVFHATSVMLHATASTLAFYLLLALLPPGRGVLPAAFIGGALFAVHPVHVEAVANVVGQSELLAAIAVLGACTVHATRGHRLVVPWRRLLLLAVLYTIALAAKEHAIVLPGLLLAIDVAQGRLRAGELNAANMRRVAVSITVLAVIAVVFLVVRSLVLGSLLGSDPNPGYSYLQGDLRLWNALRAWPEYLRLLLFPYDLSVDYSPDVVPVADGLSLTVAVGALLLLVTLVIALRSGRSLFGLAAGWFFLTILPVSNLLFPIGVLVAERTLYLPSFATSVVAAAFASRLEVGVAGGEAASAADGAPAAARTAVVAITLLALIALGVHSFTRGPVWKSTASVQRSLIQDHPESFRAQWTLGSIAAANGDRERADLHYERSYRIYGDDPIFLLEYANYLLRGGLLERALPLLQEARRFEPEHIPARVTSALVFNRTGHPDSALILYRALQQEGVVRGDVVPEIARALEGMGDHLAASEAWRAGAHEMPVRGWLYHAMSARAASRAGDSNLASSALADAWASASRDTAASPVLAKVQELIASGCYARGNCVGDPLTATSP